MSEEVYQAIDEESPMYENFDGKKKPGRAGGAPTYGGAANAHGGGGGQEMYENFDVKKNAPRGVAAAEQEMYENVDHDRGAKGKGAKEDDMSWLHGMLSREEVNDLFEANGMREGIFLVRESTKRAGDYVMSVYNSPKIQHFIIANESGVYSIDDGPKFHSLPELVNYYLTTTDRLPTRPVTPIRRSATAKVHKPESYEQVWEAGNSDQAQFGTQMTMGKGSSLRTQDSSVKRGPVVTAVEPGDPYSVSDSAPLHGGNSGSSLHSSSSGSSLKGKSAAATAAPAAATGSTMRRQPSIQAAPINDPDRGDFTNLPRVKKWIDAGDSINSVQLTVVDEKKKAIEGFSADSSERAAIQLEKFSKAALAEEKMYLFWMNSHLKKVEKSTADISESLKNGCLILEVIKLVSNQPAPMYAKRPTVMQQQMDNWHVVIKYMRKLGIQVDNVVGATGEVESVGLDADALFNLDRREILKLFSKLLMYENTLKK